MLRLHITGVGDAFTERYHNASFCVEETGSGVRLQIDCPPAFPRALADYRQKSAHGAELRIDTIDHLLLTHLHGDHCGGTEAYLYMHRFLLGRKPTLVGAPEVLDALWPTRLRGGMSTLLKSPTGPSVELDLLDYCQRQDLAAGVTHVGPLQIERRFTIHHIPTTALRISLPGRARPLVSYSADTAFDPELIAWLGEADLIIHETNFGVHTPLASLMTLPDPLRARMRLIHYPDQLHPADSPIPCLYEGQTIDLP